MHTADPTKAPTTENLDLQAIVERLVETYRPERIYLFGSAARGDAGPDSDYDLMIVSPTRRHCQRRNKIAAVSPVL